LNKPLNAAAPSWFNAMRKELRLDGFAWAEQSSRPAAAAKVSGGTVGRILRKLPARFGFP